MAARRRQADRRNWPANLYLNSSGTYWYRHPGTKKTFSLGKDLKVAMAQARTVNAELERQKGEVGLLQRIAGAGMLLAEWCDRFYGIVEGRGELVKKSLATVNGDLNAIKRAPFADFAVAHITPLQIVEWVKSVAEKISGSRAARLRARLVEVLDEAIAHGLLEVGRNPAASVFKPRAVVTRNRLTLDDFKAIVAEAEKADSAVPWAANAFKLALLTGQRREDIKEMRFEHVKDGFLYVEQHKSKGRTKLKIPVSIGLKALGMTIEDAIRGCRDNVVSKSMIHHVRHKGVAKPGDSPKIGTFSDAFALYRDNAKIKAPEGRTPVTFHEIRSLAARLYSEQYGADFAQALLGHKSAAMTALYRDSRGREWTEVKAQPSKNFG